MARTGYAQLPLHNGRAPRYLFERMVPLAREIMIFLVTEFGRIEALRRLSDPYWFQAFGCVLGFDWHSSGLTTTVCGALKQGLRDAEKEIGIYVGGGNTKSMLAVWREWNLPGILRKAWPRSSPQSAMRRSSRECRCRRS